MTMSVKRLTMSISKPDSGEVPLVRQTLQRTSPFRSWPTAAFNELIGEARIRSYAKDAVIMRRGDIAKAIHVIAGGTVEIGAESIDGRRYVIRYAGPNHAFGLLSVLDGRECPHYYLAYEATSAILVGKDSFFAILNRHMVLWQSLLSEVNERYRFALRQIEDYTFEPLRMRLVKALLVLVESYGIKQQNGTVIQLRLAQDHLGYLLGVSRQSVNKAIRQLEGEGVIRMHYGTVLVRDIDALREIAHPAPTGASGIS